MTKSPLTLFTVGHSTHSIEEFVAILKAFGIEQLVDIRTVPRSRQNPQFNRDSLPSSLAPYGIEYVHMADLGGLRHTRKDSINTAWENASFRGYADYMQTDEFGAGLNNLIDIAKEKKTAFMCAEAVPWRCHRSLVADALVARGINVEHILGEKSTKPHKMTSFAQVQGDRLTYPGGQGKLPL